MVDQYFQDSNMVDFMMDMESVPYISKIELTNICQLKCPGCPTGTLQEQDRVDINLGVLQKMVDLNYFRSTTYVELMMSGEATLHRHFSEAVDIIKSSGVMVGVSTNLVDRHKIPALCKLDSITVSMDVFDKEGYERSRPPMKFDRLIENIRELVAEADADTLIYLQLLRTPITEPYFLSSVEKAREFICSLGKKNVVLRYVSDCFGEVMNRKAPQQKNKMCTTPFAAVVIKSSGSVHPCGYCFTGKEEGLLLGDINNQRLEDIWVGDPVESLRLAHRTQTHLPPRCLQCDDRNRNNHIFQSSITVDILRHRSGILIR